MKQFSIHQIYIVFHIIAGIHKQFIDLWIKDIQIISLLNLIVLISLLGYVSYK